MIKIKNRCCYTVTLILCGTLFLTGLTGCKSREAQFLIDGLQEAKAEVDAESSEEKTSGKKSKKDTDEKKADTEDRQNDGGNSAEFRKKQAESDGSDAGNGTGSDSGKHTSDADIDNGSEAVSDKEMQQAMIYVDVCGAVANPGVFQLAAGSRVFQAIEAARISSRGSSNLCKPCRSSDRRTTALYSHTGRDGAAGTGSGRDVRGIRWTDEWKCRDRAEHGDDRSGSAG